MNFLSRALPFLLALPLLPARAAAADPKCDRCKDLPRLEKELFEQEWLQHEFREYAMGNKTPPPRMAGQSSTDSMVDQVTADFTAWLKSPAGGGKGSGAPELATKAEDCSLVSYRKFTPAEAKAEAKTAAAEKRPPKKLKDVPFDEAAYRKKNCKELADAFIAHEQKHVEQCKKSQSGYDLSNHYDYSSYDTEAYGAGIRNLRASIAKLAKECGWQGSTDGQGNPKANKKNPEDGQDEDIVPTMKEAKDLAKSLKKGATK